MTDGQSDGAGPSSGVRQGEKKDVSTTKSTGRYIMSINSNKPKPKSKSNGKSGRQGYFGRPQCPVGTMFASRKECSEAGVHHPSIAGISCSTTSARGDGNVGAFSIVLNGGYAEDVDKGYTIHYCGAGGKMNNHGESAQQVEDQSMNHNFNKALRFNISTGKPVRVVRGYKNPSKWAPKEGYRYDGLYKVTKHKVITGESGHQVCMFRLKRLPDQTPLEDLPVAPA